MVQERQSRASANVVRTRIGFIGSGRVARVLAPCLASRGYAVTSVASRNGYTSRALARVIEGCQAARTAQEVVERADLVFLTVPDDVIGPTAARLRWRQGVAAVHCSGSLGSNVLSTAVSDGALVGSFHPLQTFANPGSAITHLASSTFAIEGDEGLVPTLEELAHAIGGRSLRLPPNSKAAYHASATLACGSVTALLQHAAMLWSTFGYSFDDALLALLPLLKGTVSALEVAGPARALTGPIARGDVGTVRRHVEALVHVAPDVLPLYAQLGLSAIPLAQEQGGLGEREANQLRDILAAVIANGRKNEPCV